MAALFALGLIALMQLSVFQPDERLEENELELVCAADFLVEEQPSLVVLKRPEPRVEDLEASPPPLVHVEREGRPPSRA